MKILDDVKIMTNMFLDNGNVMNIRKRMTVKNALKPVKVSSLLLLTIYANSIQASSVTVSVGQFDYRTNMSGEDIDYKPSGVVVGGSLDISEVTTFEYELGKWSDQATNANMRSDFDSTMLAIGLTHEINDWQYSVFYSDLKDEIATPLTSMGLPGPGMFVGEEQTDTDVMSIELNASYQMQRGNWAYYTDIGLQFNDVTSSGTLPQTSDQTFRQEDESIFAMLSLGADKYFANNDLSGWLLGSTLTWYQELSSDSEMILASARRAGRGGQNGDNFGNRTTGDSFGVIGAYATYMINSKWSLDASASFGFAGDFNANTYDLTLGYSY